MTSGQASCYDPILERQGVGHAANEIKPQPHPIFSPRAGYCKTLYGQTRKGHLPFETKPKQLAGPSVNKPAGQAASTDPS